MTVRRTALCCQIIGLSMPVLCGTLAPSYAASVYVAAAPLPAALMPLNVKSHFT